MLTMMGGLALFLYGMFLMSKMLVKIADKRFDIVLSKLTDSSLKTVLVGAGVTALVQSSSTVTVMVVGLADCGMMGLRQAAGIIMGANIGTTVTSWILGIAETESSSSVTDILSPVSLAPLMAIAGTVVCLLSSKEKNRNTASALVGFSMLMFGMKTMSQAAEPLVSDPQTAALITRYANPVYCMLAGIVITAVIQSSSASMGILQALCAAKTVSYAVAVPMIMGQNIGSCVTAMIAAMAAGRNAKCAALIHLYFNIIGTFIFMTVFYAANAVCSFDFLDNPASGFGIALIHSVFNIFSAILLSPFTDSLVRLARMTVGKAERCTL